MNLKLTLIPKMIIELIAQLIICTLTESEAFLIGVIAVLGGINLGWTWGLFIYFSVYFLTHMVGNYISLVAGKLHLIAQAISHVRDEKS